VLRGDKSAGRCPSKWPNVPLKFPLCVQSLWRIYQAPFARGRDVTVANIVTGVNIGMDESDELTKAEIAARLERALASVVHDGA
jgi:hypothetical protein